MKTNGTFCLLASCLNALLLDKPTAHQLFLDLKRFHIFDREALPSVLFDNIQSPCNLLGYREKTILHPDIRSKPSRVQL